MFTQCEVYCLAVITLDEAAWATLRQRAREAASTSYAPYSHVTVGAAAYTSDGRLVQGANVENASYGLTLCAECSLVSDLIRQGGGELVAASIVAGDSLPIAPCGRCRQVLYEHGPDLLIDAGAGVPARALRELLPEAFGPEDLGIRRNP